MHHNRAVGNASVDINISMVANHTILEQLSEVDKDICIMMLMTQLY